ncbi:uncharacterized protein CANTADRAFT_178686 [Suhomyces tanzawaensis NRRL Y-17324]|uniref:Uncharacterized protein n=1 Tax=Suhomyces tanzawaensis NRRL Y-17324 TaxID=984487 RepID=A0A1E4SMW6_9ASCO|nr:uncharacterized protein CANTADRAFT_178686 [Suhomyces tanzawaensis NRRL Y-17324]ODV80828.1 hypothetical protein CANTADRAFT_178686 [Suhomyces tanzawaensis NRRL Y-17324]
MLSYIPQILHPFPGFNLPFACHNSHSHLDRYHDLVYASAPEVKQVDTKEGCQIQISKDSGDFESYKIRLAEHGEEFQLKISSEVDEFERIFTIDSSMADMELITWKLYREEGLLVINIPKHKKGKHTLRAAHKESKKQRRLERELKRRRKEQKRLRAAKKLAKRQRKQEQEQEDYNDNSSSGVDEAHLLQHQFEESSEPETSETSEYETPSTDSECDSHPESHSSSPTKPTLEEIEDEEFVMYHRMINHEL